MHCNFTGEKLEAALQDAREKLGHYDFEWCAFSQMWPSTALGFGGMGGSAMTTATTIIAWRGNQAEVYFDGRHAYTAERRDADKWIKLQRVPSLRSYIEREQDGE